MTPDTEVTLDNCAREPIHIPGSIQPHGVLFACSGERLLVEQVSDNVTAMLGTPEAVGRSLFDLLDPASTATLERAAKEPDKARELNPITVRTVGGDAWDAMVHRSVSGPIIVELELHQAAAQTAFDHRLRASVVRLQSASDLASLTRLATEEVREISGFDRVMVYRFDDDWNGEVVAESKRDDLEPFLGLHYPASDIPAQARRLYTVNLLRFIADVDYRPSPLVPRVATPLDLSHASLRSVSPIHIEYLKNMGVTASMSVSLVIDGQLAGLIACHHYSGPHLVPYRVRDTIEFLAQAFAWQLRILEGAAAAERDRNIAAHEAKLVETVASTPNFRDGLLQQPLLDLAAADGAAVVLDDGISTIGDVPTDDKIRALVRDLRVLARDAVAVDGPSDDLPGLSPAHPGVLAVTISQALGEYIIWFRIPTEQTVDWAGDPRKVVTSVEGAPPRLSPRGSFALWRETVRGHSLPWERWHVGAASNLRRLILGGVRLRSVELRTINERLLEADRAKDDFISVVSHELRSPLNAILGYHQLLESGSAKIEKGLEVIGRNARMLTELVDDLLDVSRMVSGKLVLSLDGVELPALVESVVEGFTLAAEAKHIHIALELDKQATPVLGDVTRLRQVIANLLSNAIKFTPKNGTITLGLARVESDVELTVTDTGQGIRADLLPLVFDMFRQGDSGLNRRSRGLGIGLALARRITELHGGEIFVTSPGEGKGATFRVRIPLASVRPPNAVVGAPAAGSMLAGLRILVVDDEADARDLVGLVLESEGAQVTLVSEASQALHLAVTQPFDLLVSDIGMPEMDGMQLIRELRARAETATLPAVALTAYNRASDRTGALQAGFHAHVPKPVDARELVAVVATQSGRLGARR